MTTAPIGIFGGTFDPIHYGHLRLAQEMAESLQLAAVRFIPAGTPPHRVMPQVSADQRLDMVRLATAGNPLFTVDTREMLRAGPGYTIDTLREVRREEGDLRPLCLLLGADAFLELTAWHRWPELFTVANVIVAHRPGFPPDAWPARMPAALAQEYAARLLRRRLNADLPAAGAIGTLAIAALDISGTMIRDSLARGVSPRYLLPDPVLDYIGSKHLYVAQEVNEAR
jgi:nicotinate-nucleotide adenylyltransferase